jgi:hypothetical protein
LGSAASRAGAAGPGHDSIACLLGGFGGTCRHHCRRVVEQDIWRVEVAVGLVEQLP